MASSGGALNLSLLSRGVGEISKNGHERIDVVFEPQDYFNFVGTSSRLYLPPIPSKYEFDGSSSTRSGKLKQDIPKTFTTRKGALLLFSEDLAAKGGQGEIKHRRHRKPHPTELSLEVSKSAEELELKTVDDLAKSILSFGGKETTTDDTDVYLGFIHNTYGRRKKDLFERQIRPGFSAKRYLSLWTKSWDDNVLGKVISKGYLTEKSLFYYNPLNPHLQRRLNDDMSHYPAPYKLMRSMLMSPGSLSGYTFYRVRPESAETIAETPEEVEKLRSPSQMGSIKVISTKDGVQKEVSYATLDKAAQEEVLTDLLVKSAVHYAMKKQQELIEENQREQAIEEVDEERSSIQQFDMRDAVDSLLDSQKGKRAIKADFGDDKSDVSDRSGSIKGKSIKRRKDKESTESSAATSPLPADYITEQDKEYVGNIPVASLRGDGSSVPQLPHIAGATPLTPIGEASREGTRMTIPVSLPPINQEHGIDEFSDESGVGVRTGRTEQTDRRHYDDSERRRRQRKTQLEETGNQTGPSLSGGYHLHSSTESLGGPASSHSLPTARPLRTHWKGSTQSLKSDRSKKGSGSLPEEGSVKGSIVIGPDGEPINVGGHIDAHVRPDLLHPIENVGDANRHFGRDLISDYESDDEPDAWKRRRRVQREDMRNYANKREKRPPPHRKVIIPPRQPSLKSKPSSANKTVRFSASSKDEGFEEIDYTAGDIDATLSMNSWSYMPRDNDPEFTGIVQQMNRASSLPGTFMRAEVSKDFTLSRATEKTEEGLSGDASPMKQVSHISVPHDDNDIDTPVAETPVELIVEEKTVFDEKPGLLSQFSHQSEDVFDQENIQRKNSTPSNGPQSRAGSRASFKNRRSISQGDMRSGSRASLKNRRSSSQVDMRSGSRASFKDEVGRRSSMSDLDRRTGSRRDGRLSKISIQSMHSPNDVVPPIEQVVEPVEEVESEREATSENEASSERKTLSEKDETSEVKDESLQKSASHKSATSRRSKSSITTVKESVDAPQSPFGTVAPSRPGSQRTGSGQGSGPTGMDLSPSPPIKTPPPTQASVRSDAADPEVKSQAPEGERSIVQSVKGPISEPELEGSGQSMQSGQISEKDIIDVLENTARQVAASTLSRSDSGQDIEKDARQAAELWLEKNAPRIISRSQSVQDVQGDRVALKSAAENGRKSAGPTAGEYKDLIKEKLQRALSNTDGESIPVIPDDAELSPELLEALKNNSLSPEDLEVVKDEETGKNIVRSRSQMSAAMGGVKEGHIYVPVAKNGQKQSGSIPTDRQSNADIGEFEVINYGGKSSDSGSKVGSAKTHSSKDKSEKLSDKALSEKSSDKGGKSQPPSILGESIVEEDEQDDHKSQRSGQRSEDGEVEEPEDEFKKAVEEVEKANEDRKSGSVSRNSDDKKSVSSLDDKKSKVSVKTEKSDAKKTPVKKEEFVVGKVSTKGELEKLFGEYGLPPPKPSGGKKKGKPKDGKGKKPTKKPGKATKGKGKAKDEEPKQAQTAEPEAEPEKEPTPPPVLPPVEDKAASDNESDKESIAETMKTEESSDFEFIRDTPSPSPPPPPKPPSTIPSIDDEPTDDEEKQEGEDDEAARLRMISNREARAAKRAAQAAKRKEDVERKRREKEEQSRREKDEQERAEQLKREMEAERRKALEAKRQKKMEEEAERDREAQMEEEKLARQKAEAEREKRRKEEYQRKLDEMRKKQAEEEQKRYEEQMQRLREEEEKRKAEEILMAQMAEEERIEYERKKKEEEEARKKKEEEDRRRREKEAQRAMEEARKLAEEMARRQAELEARMKFNRELQVEAKGLDHSHNITEAFVFSYFELLNWFGLDIPEFEMLKINQY